MSDVVTNLRAEFRKLLPHHNLFGTFEHMDHNALAVRIM